MPFPPNAFTIHGGCNCGAIRYEVSVPPQAERPMAPYHTPGVSIDQTLPTTIIDHCGDCRRATAAVFNTWLVSLLANVRMSVRRRGAERNDANGDEAEWLPAHRIVAEECLVGLDTCLGRYRSSVKASRWFCNHCGTQLFYSLVKAYTDQLGMPPMIDILIGSVDPEDLEQEWMKPDAMIWCSKAVPWARELALKGAADIPAAPLWKVEQSLNDDIEADLKMLAGLSEWSKRPQVHS